MRLRVFIIGPGDAMRASLAMHVEDLGHEVVTAANAESCPCCHSDTAACHQEAPCGDALILAQELPALKGIEFIERKASNGCKGAVAHNAIICRPWSEDVRRRAKAIGCRFFETPLALSELTAWLREVADNTPANRRLAPLRHP